MAADQDPAKAGTISALSERMRRADWWYSFSDDYDERRRASKEIDGIYKDLAKLHAADPETVRDLWQKHAPKEWTKPRNLLTPEERCERQAMDERVKALLDEYEPDEKPPMSETSKDAVKSIAEKIHKQIQSEKAHQQQPVRDRGDELER